jgi:hypothetical protein
MVLIRLVLAVLPPSGSVRPIIFARQERHHDAPSPDQADAWRSGADREVDQRTDRRAVPALVSRCRLGSVALAATIRPSSRFVEQVRHLARCRRLMPVPTTVR